MRRAAALVVCALACGGAAGERPVATLSTSPEVGTAFAGLRDAFEHDVHDVTLTKRFDDFIRKFPKDRVTPLARLHLGHVLLDMNDSQGAKRELARVKEPPPGNERDFWLALRARLLRHDGHADDALVLLQPLVGTVVDLPLRTILLEEVAVASIDARRSLEAVAYLDGWLRSVPPHAHKDAHDRVREQLGRIEPRVLAQTLEAMQGDGAGGYSAELQRLVAESLSKHALEVQDTLLAQRLIDSSLAKYLTGTAAGQDLRDLATSLRGSRAVVARTIGLVLPTDTPELRDAAADAARGAAFALGLPRPLGSDAGSEGTRLVTRADTEASLDASLEELAGAGAAVVLAGIDEASAERACRWAEENGLALITLSAPKTPGQRFCFVAGESHRTSLALLVSDLEKRAGTKTHRKVASITGTAAEKDVAEVKSSTLELLPPHRCEPPYSRSRIPLAEWSTQGVHDFLVSAPSGCVRALLPALPRGSDVGLALETSAPGDEGAHIVPAGVHAFAVTPVASPQLDEYKQKLGAKPSYWTAIGRDAALLAHAAEVELPTDRATSSTEITRRRELARAGLLAAKATLWTTDRTGFAGDHKLPRTLRIVDLP